MTSVYSNESNQSVISALLVHRIDSGVLLSAGDLRRLQAARNASEGPAAASKANLLHPAPIIGSNPPPGCPMHASSPSSSSPSSSSRTPASTGSSQLKRALPTSFAALSSKASGSMSSASGDACPVPHDQRDAYMASQGQNKKIAEQLNPLNNMPELAQSAMSSKQHSLLSTERTLSSIPRSVVSPSPGASPYDAPTPPGACPVAHDVKGKGKEEAVHGQVSHWEYPSPQQFYNALVRKGWETPEEHVDMMVLIHNFLNERAWQEVIEWERLAGTDVSRIQLARFQGRPGTLSPKARLQGYLAWLMPSKYSSEPPFDRHDWIIQRPPPASAASESPSQPSSTEADLKSRQIRYVIDYYEAPSDPDEDEAAFNLDVRPAVDSFEALKLRARRVYAEWGKEQHEQVGQAHVQG